MTGRHVGVESHTHGPGLFLGLLFPDGRVRDEVCPPLVELEGQQVLARLEVLAPTVFEVASSFQPLFQSLVLPSLLSLGRGWSVIVPC